MYEVVQQRPVYFFGGDHRSKPRSSGMSSWKQISAGRGDVLGGRLGRANQQRQDFRGVFNDHTTCNPPSPKISDPPLALHYSFNNNAYALLEGNMASRIFIKGLPPTLTEAEFRKHFSQNSEITDAKIFPSRRIGYVGYKTPEDAKKAVKYHNKSFIRMSKIGVELARPPRDAEQTVDSKTRRNGAPTARRGSSTYKSDVTKKRRQSQGEQDAKQDPALKEFLEVMRPKSKKRAWEDDIAITTDTVDKQDEPVVKAVSNAGESDDEYEDVPRPSKRLRENTGGIERIAENGMENSKHEASNVPESNDQDAHQDEQGAGFVPPAEPAASDADWARSRTSRLLGLLDDDEELGDNTGSRDQESSASENEDKMKKGVALKGPVHSIPTPPGDDVEDQDASDPPPNLDIEAVRSSMRLFVRNLPYDVKSEDLEELFDSSGNLEEVSHAKLSFAICLMNPR